MNFIIGIFSIELYVGGVKRPGDGECDLSDRPHGELRRCANVNSRPFCGNGILEDGEECEPAIDGQCCTSSCAWSTETSQCDKHVDAAFMSNPNDGQKLYLISRSLVYRYSNGQENFLDSGYPKQINQEWFAIDSEIGSNLGGIVRKPGVSEIILFAKRYGDRRDIKYQVSDIVIM